VSITLRPTDPIVDKLRRLVEENLGNKRLLDFYAERLAMTSDRLNKHVKRATGVTAGHLIRQRVLSEAKRQLVFSDVPIHKIAYDLAFSDPSHFARFFRQQTGATPQTFRKKGTQISSALPEMGARRGFEWLGGDDTEDCETR
jgi:AraC family transcriptional activator of pobA